jgi:hypothetical protein
VRIDAQHNRDFPQYDLAGCERPIRGSAIRKVAYTLLNPNKRSQAVLGLPTSLRGPCKGGVEVCEGCACLALALSPVG